MHNREVALVTGGASGLGFELAKICLERKMQVILVDCCPKNLDEAKKNLSPYQNDVYTFPCDISSIEAVNALALIVKNRFGHLNWLFNNAGISGPCEPLWETLPEQFHRVMSINVSGAYYMTQAFVPLLLQQSIPSYLINIASLYGLCATSLNASYTTSKFALIGLSESLFYDLKRIHAPIHVSVACPSFMSTGLIKEDASHPFQNQLARMMQLARPPQEVAEKIIDGALKNKFYLFPDAEVKDIFLEKTEAMLQDTPPPMHTLERLVNRLVKRTTPLSLETEI